MRLLLCLCTLFISTSAFAQISWNGGLTELQWALADGNDARAFEIIKAQPEQVHALSQRHHSSPFTHRTVWSTVQVAVAFEREAVLAEMLKHRPDLNYQDPVFGYSALHLAAQSSRGGLEQLLRAGANVSLQTGRLSEAGHREGTDALFMAINMENLEAVKLLMKYGANPARIQSSKYPANALNVISFLFRCIYEGPKEVECGVRRMKMLEAVIDYPGMDVNFFDRLNKTTPIMEIARNMSSYEDREEWSRALAVGVRLLESRGADLCLRGAFGSTMEILKDRGQSNNISEQLYREFSQRHDCR